MINLKGKSILFISSKAFGIPENIIKELINLGAIVDYYDERPANNFLTKALIRINRILVAPYINFYYNKIIKQTSTKKYDYIFFIKAESISHSKLKLLFSLHPESTNIIYHWDSIANNKNALNTLPEFDYAFSFDRKDCKKFNMHFLPLFYYNEYKDIALSKENKIFDLLFVGTVHSDRYKIINSIITQFSENGYNYFTYFFFQSKIMFYRYLLINKKSLSLKKFQVHFNSLNKEDLLELYKKSRTIIDIQHPKQTGLTLRTFEALGSKCKLITTNKDIKNYNFYHPNNILIIDRNKPVIPKSFLELDYYPIPDAIYESYSITSWIKSIFYNTSLFHRHNTE